MNFRELVNIKEDIKRNVKLTSIISITATFLLFLIGFLYYLAGIEGTQRLPLLLMGSSFIFIIPFLLNKSGYITAGRMMLSILLPFVIILFSIDSKMIVIGENIINPVNYFDIRIALINALVVPIVIFSLKESLRLFIAILPSLLGILFFDPIHEYFNVSYYDMGLMSRDYYFSANLYSIITVAFLTIVMIFLKNEILKGEFKQVTENSKIKLYLDNLIELSKSSNINKGKVDAAKKEVLLAAKTCLGVSRVSLWTYDHKNKSIQCEYLLDENGLNPSDLELTAVDYPLYFDSIQRQQLVIATEARKNISTQEFTQHYLEPLGIYSLMDAAFLHKGKFGGVLCCEHQHELKDWDAAESILLKFLADFISYTKIVHERITQNVLLEEKNAEKSKMNVNLEAQVYERTEELAKKNEQLTEYAYINAHILRAPVARISGLYYLFKKSSSQKHLDPDLIGHFTNSISELEKVTFQINRAIEEHGNINRSEFEGE